MFLKYLSSTDQKKNKFLCIVNLIGKMAAEIMDVI